jgi:hypothetical protein
LYAQLGRPPCAAEPRIELGPALQQADDLPYSKPTSALQQADEKLKVTVPTVPVQATTLDVGRADFYKNLRASLLLTTSYRMSRILAGSIQDRSHTIQFCMDYPVPISLD